MTLNGVFFGAGMGHITPDRVQAHWRNACQMGERDGEIGETQDVGRCSRSDWESDSRKSRLSAVTYCIVPPIRLKLLL